MALTWFVCERDRPRPIKKCTLSLHTLIAFVYNVILLVRILKVFCLFCLCNTQGNCATEGNSGNCQSGNCHSGERWMREPSVHGGK